ncbi:hypothetical protein ZIOFF_051394 [Zingiber officinale]|uniref:Peroxisomal membrane protein PMP22 n=1 Tax=Zingiber officinale TaxID=94328 RepID=A0A8J5KRV6_ZINOF|nr:hypothetical protein ZIOFF_051394 [Zingiber officinale]
MGAVVKKGWENYMLQLQLHPLRTKMLTAGVLAGISDSAAQKLSGIPKIQLRRLLLKVVLSSCLVAGICRHIFPSYSMTNCCYVLQLFGFAYGGPFGHYLHKLLDIIFKGKKDSKTVAKKVLLEQVTSSPWNHFLFLMYYGLIVESRPWPEVKEKVKKDYPSVQLTAWMFWPVVGWVNHQYMPLQFRVIFHSLVACCWGIFLNLRARTKALNK